MPSEAEYQHPTIRVYALSLHDLRQAEDSLEALHRRISKGGKLAFYRENTKWMEIINDVLTVIDVLRDQVVEGAQIDCATEELLTEMDENRWRYHGFIDELNRCLAADANELLNKGK